MIKVSEILLFASYQLTTMASKWQAHVDKAPKNTAMDEAGLVLIRAGHAQMETISSPFTTCTMGLLPSNSQK